MRVGVVGGGYWGSKHVRVLSALASVDEVVVIEPDQARRDSLATAFRPAAAVASLSEGLDLVDAVVVATPARTHAPVTRVVLDAGKHVMVEKPMATSTADARSLVELAERNELTLMVGHTFEHHEPVKALRRIIASGDLGEIRYISSSRLNLGLYQSDVNVVWDLAPHDVSILNYLLGSVARSVDCWGWANTSHQHEDVAQMDLGYGDQLSGQIHVSWLHPSKVRQITVVGTSKMAVYDDLDAAHPIRVIDRGVDLATDEASGVSYRDGAMWLPSVDQREPLAVEDEHFVRCILDGVRPSTDGRSGLAVTATLEAAEISLRDRRRVGLDELLDPSQFATAGIAG